MPEDIDLPPLPDPYEVLELWGQNVNVYDSNMLREYALSAVRADRMRRGDALEVRAS